MALRDKTLAALRTRRLPAWWADAKLGIFVHWTPASVPAFAPVDDEIGELMRSGRPDALAWSPYSEWYENSLRFPQSPAAQHHRATYGSRPYESFAADWEAGLEQWDPDAWTETFAAAGARYVVLVAKHHDGYCLWPTEIANPKRPGWHCKRDVVGELREAVRARGMRFGLYYSGGLDWRFNDRPIGTFADMVAAIPRGDYPAYAEAHVRELITRYRPNVLWNDIAWPAEGKQLWPLFAHYYAQVPDGVVNDRWMPWSPLLGATKFGPVHRLIDKGAQRQAQRDAGVVPPKPPHFDVRTPEYVVFPDVQRTPWECVRGMDKSFGHNAQSRPDDFLSRDELLWSLVDIVSKGGNLLLNVGPRGVDAQIPEQQQTRLQWLAEFPIDALRATRPWITSGDGDVRYVARDNTVFAFVRHGGGQVVLGDVQATPTTAAEGIDGNALAWSDTGAGLRVSVPTNDPAVVVLRDVEVRPSRS